VLENILAMDAAGVHVEITNLLIPGLNDSEEQVRALCGWMVENGMQRVPLHFSRYFPRYRMAAPGPTPKQSLLRAREVALALGIEAVYLGNV
jgi:pyruvate formate lyase activating enzyme